jgi:predicted RNA-binding protein YlxR (DUF448 family)
MSQKKIKNRNCVLCKSEFELKTKSILDDKLRKYDSYI